MRTSCFGLCYINVHLELATGLEDLWKMPASRAWRDFLKMELEKEDDINYSLLN